MSSLVIKTSLGNIKLTLRPDAAPVTVEYISKCVKQGLYDSTTFYRSDFVIQVVPHEIIKQNKYTAF